MSEEHQSEPARLRVRLEGWRFLGHSYSFVHQWQALELSRRSNCLVGMRDLPALPAVTKWNGPPWKRLHNIFDASDEARLAEFSDIAAPDAVVRMAFPISFRGEPAARTFVFAPGDTGWCPRILIEGNEELREAHARSEVVLLTPSKWSAWGLLRAGADPRRVAVVPHGVAPEIFCPAPDEIRQQLRQQLNWKDRFIFLNVSALTFNKGIDILLRSFARIAERFPNVVLALKGNDEIYPSADVLQHIMQTTLTEREKRAIAGRIHHVRATLRFRRLASLYQAADCYVAPYRRRASTCRRSKRSRPDCPSSAPPGDRQTISCRTAWDLRFRRKS